MQKLIILFTFLAIFVSACSSSPFIYQVKRQQGNAITKEMISQLKLGMTKEQVQFIMGSPVLDNTFRDDRWTYVYTFNIGRKQVEKKHLILFFQDDKLHFIENKMES